MIREVDCQTHHDSIARSLLMSTGHSLSALLSELPGARLVRGNPATIVDSVEHDSRTVAAHALFVAIPGFKLDAHAFLPDVIGRGATAVIVQEDHASAWQSLAGEAAVISVPSSRPALADAAAWFHGHPAREMVVVGITGTDGKTTTSYLATAVLEAAGLRVGRMGTVDAYIAGEPARATDRMTTPEATEVQALLRRMADADCDYAIVESTSHGLALNRLDHCEYDIAAFTNVTGDHLDFHGTFEAYRDAKAKLFAALDASMDKGIPKSSVVNMDDPSAGYMLSRSAKAEPIRYGLDSREAELVARNIILHATGSDFRVMGGGRMADVSIALPALFNVYNALCAAGIGLAAGLEMNDIARGLSQCAGVPGRMERIESGQPFTVLVDFAHTGDSVRKVLQVLREVSKGKLIVVVGAAGERDPGRRFGVARAAAEGADFAVFTNEDPRSEDPRAIVAEIGRHAAGAGKVRGRDFLEIEDRREAIATAFKRAQAGDLVVILGKGHEQSIIIGDRPMPWDDRDVAREELANLGHK